MTIVTIAITLFFLVFLGIPIAFALGITGLIAIWTSTSAPLQLVPLVIFNQANSYTLVAVPMFMLAGAIVETCGLGRVLVDFASSLAGWARGGLAQVNILVSLIFAGMNGSAPADVASIGSILMPEMKRKGYPAGFTAAVTSSSSELAILIPPSISLILYGVLANVSIAKMFIAGIIPGILIAVSDMALVHYLSVRHRYPVHEPFSLLNVLTNFRRALWGLSLPIIILGGILGGFFTATESAAAAAVTSLILALVVYRSMGVADLGKILVITVKRTGLVMLIIASAGLLSYYLADQEIPQALAKNVIEITDNRYALLAIIIGSLLLAGTLISGAPAIVLFVPILLPIATAAAIDPIHFGIIFSLCIAIGTQTPPVAPTMLLACAISETSVEEVWKTNRWFIAVNVVVLIIVAYIPAISLWLPSLF